MSVAVRMATETEVPKDVSQAFAPIVTADAATSKSSEVVEKKHTKKRKKRQRGQKAKMRAVTAIGEESRDRQLGKGKVRQLDILRGNPNSAKLPRKTRELLSRMNKFKEETENEVNGRNEVTGGGSQNKRTADGSKGFGNSESVEHTRKHARPIAAKAPGGDTEASGDRKGQLQDDSKEMKATEELKQSSKKRKFDGMQPGENFAQFSARLRKESKQMILDTARKGNHQREKKRAYYEKRKERAMRKRKRNRGDFGDSDVEDNGTDDWDESRSTAHLPSYWQEILHNNGRPISAKQRKRLQRAEDQAADDIAFGEQAERPPEFSAFPVRRGRKDGV